MSEMKNIFITGVSSGLGRAMAQAGLQRGHRVIGTLRKEEQRSEFEALVPDRAIGRLLDVTDTAAIAPLINDLELNYGPLDVLINNAGYGLRGVVEELHLDELRHQFDVNVFAPIALIQAVLPGMRSRRKGHIVNVSSMGGIITFPGLGSYHGSKFAMNGLSDTLAKELKPLGIFVTSIMPGVFRSDWNGRSQAHTEHAIKDYDGVLEEASRGDLKWGDPAALGEVVIKTVEMDEPPEHLLVGPTALRLVRQRLADLSAEIDKWAELSRANDEG